MHHLPRGGRSIRLRTIVPRGSAWWKRPWTGHSGRCTRSRRAARRGSGGRGGGGHRAARCCALLHSATFAFSRRSAAALRSVRCAAGGHRCRRRRHAGAPGRGAPSVRGTSAACLSGCPWPPPPRSHASAQRSGGGWPLARTWPRRRAPLTRSPHAPRRRREGSRAVSGRRSRRSRPRPHLVPPLRLRRLPHSTSMCSSGRWQRSRRRVRRCTRRAPRWERSRRRSTT